MLQHTWKKQGKKTHMASSMLKVAIFDFDSRISNELASYFSNNFYAQVEWDNGTDIGAFIAKMAKFKPTMFVVSQLCATPRPGEPDPTLVDLENHCVAVRAILHKFLERPYLVAIANTLSMGSKHYRRYKAVCEEFGYDTIALRTDVNSHTIGEWVHKSRKH